MNQYIISEVERNWIIAVTKGDMCWNKDILEIMEKVCPYNPQADREKVLDNLGMYLDAELEKASQFNAMRNFAFLDVKRKIEELRQSKDGE